MSVERRAYLSNALRTRFDAETRELSILDRMKWLLAHLEEYLDRWTSFCVRKNMSMAILIQGDLHTMLLIAVELIDQEMAAVVDCDQFRRNWLQFAQTVREIRGDSDKSIVEVLERTLANAQSGLLSCLGEPNSGSP